MQEKKLSAEDLQKLQELFYATDFKAEEIIAFIKDKCIAQNIDLNKISIHKDCTETLLHTAARCNSAKLINFLIEKGIGVDALDAKGNTALFMLFENKRGMNDESLRALLTQKATVHTSDNNTIMHKAAKNYPETIKLLIDSGVEVDCINVKGETPLTLLFKRKLRVAEIIALLEKGANPNKEFELMGKKSCLAEAIRAGEIELAKYLLAKGAAILPPSDASSTAAEHASKFLLEN